jgi:hypothetical protein
MFVVNLPLNDIDKIIMVNVLSGQEVLFHDTKRVIHIHSYNGKNELRLKFELNLLPVKKFQQVLQLIC